METTTLGIVLPCARCTVTAKPSSRGNTGYTAAWASAVSLSLGRRKYLIVFAGPVPDVLVIGMTALVLMM
jgi:hypothetical protein